MSKKSAGLLLYRETTEGVEVLLVHPGGPFWAKKDGGSWSIPKGEFADDEEPLSAAKREFDREVISIPEIELKSLDVDPRLALRALFDYVWNAGGYRGSLNYDEDGVWRRHA